MNGCNG